MNLECWEAPLKPYKILQQSLKYCMFFIFTTQNTSKIKSRKWSYFSITDTNTNIRHTRKTVLQLAKRLRHSEEIITNYLNNLQTPEAEMIWSGEAQSRTINKPWIKNEPQWSEVLSENISPLTCPKWMTGKCLNRAWKEGTGWNSFPVVLRKSAQFWRHSCTTQLERILFSSLSLLGWVCFPFALHTQRKICIL